MEADGEQPRSGDKGSAKQAQTLLRLRWGQKEREDDQSRNDEKAVGKEELPQEL